MEKVVHQQHYPHDFTEFKPRKKSLNQNIANYFKLAVMGSPVLVMDIVGSDGEVKTRRKLNVEIG